MVALAKLASVSTGVGFEPACDEAARFIQIRDLDGNRRALVEGRRPRVARAVPVVPGDVLLAARGERNSVMIADNHLFGAYATLDVYLIRPRQDFLDPGFLAALLRLPQTGVRLRASTAGALLPRIPKDALASLEVPLPPLDRQRTIGDLERAQRSYCELLGRLASRHARLAELQIAHAVCVQ